MLLLLHFFNIIEHAQNKLATQHRLQVCALRITSQQTTFLEGIRLINQLMNPIRTAIYALRAARLVPGAGLISVVSERFAVATLRVLAKTQLLAIKAYNSTRTLSNYCRSTKYSSHMILCRSPILKRSRHYRRTKPLLSDLKGDIYFTQDLDRLFHVRCTSTKFALPVLQSKIRLYGDRHLKWKQLEYAYEK